MTQHRYHYRYHKQRQRGVLFYHTLIRSFISRRSLVSTGPTFVSYDPATRFRGRVASGGWEIMIP